ncbi:MAG: Ig-like domain-containing protein, partial [bacterium]
MNDKHYVIVFFVILFPVLVLTQVTGLQGWDIFVDPGHSQNENMPPFSWAISEAKRNVRVALQLREILMTETDIDTVYLSRTNDIQQVSLSQRTNLANSLNAQWYHSIHSDASGSPAANSTLLLWGQYQNGDEKIPNGGKAMSDIMIDHLTDGMRTYTVRGSIGDCTFYGCTFWGPYLHVNRETIMPSELSEAGFHTNYQQNMLFMNNEWRRLEARTFYWSILDYHNIPRPPAHILTGYVTNLESDQRLNGAVITAGGQQYTTDTYQSLFYMYTSEPELLHNGFYYLENMDFDSVDVGVEMTDYYPDSGRVAISDNFFTFKDFQLVSKLPPYLLSSVPATGDTAVSILDDILLNFSRPMSRASVDSHMVISPDISPTFYWLENDTRLLMRTDSLHFLTTYTITLPGTIEDRYGHLFDGDGNGIGGDTLVITFTTGMDVFPPEAISFYPRLYQRDVERRPIINIEFDEELADTSVKPSVFLLEEFSSHTSIPGTLQHYVVEDRSVLNYFPSVDLLPDKVHVTRLYAGLQDLLGNTMTRNYSVSFTPMEADEQMTNLDRMESGFASYWMQPLWSGSTTGTNPANPPYMSENDSIVNLLTGSNRAMELFYSWDLNAGAWLLR